MKLIKILSATGIGVFMLATAGGMVPFAFAEPGGPTVTLSSPTTGTTTTATIPVTVTFSGSVTGFTSGDIVATNATVQNFVGSSTSYTFNLLATSTGTVTVLVPADVATDSATQPKTNQASNTLTFTYAPATDTTAPVISSVVATPSATGSTITWTTNEPTIGQVFYGTTTSYGSSSTLETSTSTSHTATLAGLTPSTTYHYQVRATDTSGNMASTSDTTFVTSAASSSTPAITNVTATPTGTSTATVMWNVTNASSTQVFYGTTTSYGSSTTLSTSTSTAQSVSLTGLQQGTVYHVQVRATNPNGTTTSPDVIFTTDSTSSSTPLAVTSIEAVKTDATADDTYVHGWEWLFHLNVPTNENAFRMKFSDFVGAAGTIPAANNIRLFSPQSSNANSEATAITETNNNYGGWLYLNGDSSTTTPGRQIDVRLQVRVPSGTPNGSYTTTYSAQSVPSTATSTTP